MRKLLFIGIIAVFFCCSCSGEQAPFDGSWVLSKSSSAIPDDHPLEWCGLVVDMQSGSLRLYSSYYDAYGQFTGGVQSGRLVRLGNNGKTAEFAIQSGANGERKSVKLNYADGKVTVEGEPEFLYLRSDLGESLERLGHTWVIDMAETARVNGLEQGDLSGAHLALEFDVNSSRIVMTMPSGEKEAHPFWIYGYDNGRIAVSMSGMTEQAVLEFGPDNTLNMNSGAFALVMRRGR